MAYEVIYDRETIDFLKKLDLELRARIFNKVASTKQNPFRYFERLEGREDYKLRVGSYRVIADIFEKSNIIAVTLIGPRGNVYKKLTRRK